MGLWPDKDDPNGADKVLFLCIAWVLTVIAVGTTVYHCMSIQSNAQEAQEQSK